MSNDELVISLRKSRKGRETTPWLDAYRDRFAQAAKEAARELEGTKLRGAAKVQEFNRRVGEKLRSRSPGPG